MLYRLRINGLEPIPKIDRHIVEDNLVIHVMYRRKKHLPTIRKIPDDLWD